MLLRTRACLPQVRPARVHELRRTRREAAPTATSASIADLGNHVGAALEQHPNDARQAPTAFESRPRDAQSMCAWCLLGEQPLGTLRNSKSGVWRTSPKSEDGVEEHVTETDSMQPALFDTTQLYGILPARYQYQQSTATPPMKHRHATTRSVPTSCHSQCAVDYQHNTIPAQVPRNTNAN